MMTNRLGLLLCFAGLAVPQSLSADEPSPQSKLLFQRLDKDSDGKLTPHEFPRPLLFQRLDRNGDGVITLAEVQRSPVAASEGNIKRDVPYGEHESQKLDVYLPGDSVAGAPIMIYIHGGGWQKGDKSAVGQKAEFFNDHGWIFISANYRLIPGGEHPKNVQDVAAAIAFVNEHAAERGGDPEKIFIMGHSAGCHLVSLVATDQRHLEKAGKSLAVVKGVIALDTQAYDVPKLTQSDFTSSTYTDVFTDDPEVQRDASPSHHITRGKRIPPFLVCYSSGLGNRPNPNRPVAANTFAAKLRDAGIAAEVIDASDRNHGEINQRFGDPDDERVTEKAMAFLDAILESNKAEK